jgi:hypothetical protein
MAIFWTLKSIPELGNMPARERRIVWRRAYRRTWHHWQTWVGLLACGICAGLGSHFGAKVDHPMFGTAIGGVVGGLIFWQASVYVARLHYKDVLLGLDK